jgi:hypothetical protein
MPFSAGPKTSACQTVAVGQVVDSHRYLESNQQIGKIVVTV